jgi:hypothetical protein
LRRNNQECMLIQLFRNQFMAFKKQPLPTRRRFLAISAAAVVVATRPPRLLAQRFGIPVFSNAALGAYQQGLLTRARFTQLVGQSFRVFLDKALVADIQLTGVATQEDVATAARPDTPAAKRDVQKLAKLWPSTDNCFILTFATGVTLVPQGSFILDHGTLGSFVVFLVPGSTTPGKATSLATFNYLPKTGIARPPALPIAASPIRSTSFE